MSYTSNFYKIVAEIKERVKYLPEWEQEYLRTRKMPTTKNKKGDGQ